MYWFMYYFTTKKKGGGALIHCQVPGKNLGMEATKPGGVLLRAILKQTLS